MGCIGISLAKGRQTMAFDPKTAAALMIRELNEAIDRINAGEPFNTTAAELGFTPAELQELFDNMESVQ